MDLETFIWAITRPQPQAPPTTNFSGKLLKAERVRPHGRVSKPLICKAWVCAEAGGVEPQLKPSTSKCLSGMQIIILTKNHGPKDSISDLPFPKELQGPVEQAKH